MDKNKKEEIKLLVFLEDNGEVKNRHVTIIKETVNGIAFNFVDEVSGAIVGVETFLPWARIMKIKMVAK